MTVDKIFYNEASAEKLGWTPEWFGCKEFDEDLVKAIKNWQKENKITADGLCGHLLYPPRGRADTAGGDAQGAGRPGASGQSALYRLQQLSGLAPV